MSAIGTILKVLFAFIAGPIVGGIIGGLLQSMGVISIGPADPASIVFSIGGVLLVGIAISWVSG